MQDRSNAFMGRGWAFPIGFSRQHGAVKMLSAEEDIRNSLDVLFATRAGERVMVPDYGSNLHIFLFSPMNKSTMTHMQAVISDAILLHEPRIVLEDIRIEAAAGTDGVLMILLTYKVSATNNRYNYVYPFYQKEATNLER